MSSPLLNKATRTLCQTLFRHLPVSCTFIHCELKIIFSKHFWRVFNDVVREKVSELRPKLVCNKHWHSHRIWFVKIKESNCCIVYARRICKRVICTLVGWVAMETLYKEESGPRTRSFWRVSDPGTLGYKAVASQYAAEKPKYKNLNKNRMILCHQSQKFLVIVTLFDSYL